MVTKRVMSSNNNNEKAATETATMIITTMATNTTTMTTTLTMMKKTMTKMATMTVRLQWLAVAGGSGGGQQRLRWRGLSVHIFMKTGF